MKKRIAAIFVILMCTIFGVLMVSYPLGPMPSMLRIHISGTPWTRVVLHSSNLQGERVFQPTDTLTLSPIAHGVYTVAVEYVTGETIWTEFFHHDAGVRIRIDLFFDGNPKTGPIKIREMANGNDILFEGQATSNETSAEKPL
jgi:hypothetical protein